MTDGIIYKIAAEDLWRQAVGIGSFAGSPVDLADGFIHFSTRAQVAETARRHYAGRDGLLLIAVDTQLIGKPLRYEPSRGGELFPHLYTPLPLAAVVWARPMPVGSDGEHVLPFDPVAG